MNKRHLVPGLVALSTLGACAPGKIWPAERQPSADERAIERRHDDERLRLCRMMSPDDPHFESNDCKNRIQVAR